MGDQRPNLRVAVRWCGCACFVLAWLWRAALVGRPAKRTGSELNPYELAMLNGGLPLAITAAIAELQMRGSLEAGERQTVQATGQREHNEYGLEEAVMSVVDRHPQISVRELEVRVGESPAARGSAPAWSATACC